LRLFHYTVVCISRFSDACHMSCLCPPPWFHLHIDIWWVQILMTSLDFSVDLTLPSPLRPWDDSASNRNEYQESSWR
jgi:hypothetical protein